MRNKPEEKEVKIFYYTAPRDEVRSLYERNLERGLVYYDYTDCNNRKRTGMGKRTDSIRYDGERYMPCIEFVLLRLGAQQVNDELKKIGLTKDKFADVLTDEGRAKYQNLLSVLVSASGSEVYVAPEPKDPADEWQFMNEDF